MTTISSARSSIVPLISPMVLHQGGRARFFPRGCHGLPGMLAGGLDALRDPSTLAARRFGRLGQGRSSVGS
ncbi:hypothetical protein PG994_012031 [Apiospora phragmitis]|uniref:Uncharacterized protein n=1 Tax=Apiospora phragmitis TaxID=2905665 RepID=A0ABR1TWR9_9PEZI